MSERKRFEGKSVVVTGAGAGMGRQIAKQFLEEGATVVAVDLSAEALEKLAAEAEEILKAAPKRAAAGETAVAAGESAAGASDGTVGSAGESAAGASGTAGGNGAAGHGAELGGGKGGRLIALAGDVSEAEVNERMLELAVAETGRLDVLVNNAGVAGHSEAIADTDEADWERIFSVDVNGPMYAIKKAVSLFLSQEGGGNIVTIASVAGIKGCRSCAAYTAAKHALVGLCEHTAYAYMHEGIRSNIVCPGAIRTGMTSKPELENKFGRERIISGMDSNLPFGTPEDIANAVLFLASDEAKFINGATLVVDGGVSCN